VEAWRTVFYIAGAVYTFGTVFYGLFGSGEIQSWATSQNKHEVELDVFIVKDEHEEKKDTARVV